MNILLLNDNPVVNKLVTLSAQKTSDELEIVDSLVNITQDSYDLFIVDDTLYNKELFEDMKGKVTFSSSLYICSRDAEEDDRFTKTIKKPFLPTDLVELLSVFGQEVSKIDISPAQSTFEDFDSTSADTLEEIEDSEDLEEFEISGLDAIDSGEDLDISDLDELEDISDESLELEELSLDNSDLEEPIESVLDKEDLEEVQNLLEEVNEESEETSSADEIEDLGELDDDDLNVEEDLDLELTLDEESEETPSEDKLETEVEEPEELEDLSLETEIETEIESEEIEDLGELDDDDLNVEEDLDLELTLDEESEEAPSEDKQDTEVEELDEIEETEEDLGHLDDDDLNVEEDLDLELTLDEEAIDETLSIEDEIENAMSELSQEDLDSEIDEGTLLDIVASEIDSIDSLNARDLQAAIGETVTAEDSEVVPAQDEKVADVELEVDNEGVEALKKLLEALSNEGVAASMKGMKISINIELGDTK